MMTIACCKVRKFVYELQMKNVRGNLSIPQGNIKLTIRGLAPSTSKLLIIIDSERLTPQNIWLLFLPDFPPRRL